MNENRQNDCNVKTSTEIPKWLDEITSASASSNMKTSLEKHVDPTSVDHIKMFEKFYLFKGSSTKDSKSHSAKYGRRSSITTELAKNLPKNIEITSSDYLVPKLDEQFDFNQFIADEITKTKQWKSLGDISKTRRGAVNPDTNNVKDNRLDNTKHFLYETEQDAWLEHRMTTYQNKIKAEEMLREHIIQELLTERRHILRADSDLLYKKNSKYKNETNNTTNSEVFIIPNLPKGKILVIEILSTWGDKHYVGLNGIEIFDDRGRVVNVEKISAVPPDINVLPEYSNDPRVVTNLLDGINRTRDDNHIWLAPFEAESCNLITLEFAEITVVSMIRIWNYNKSRIYSYRGARDVNLFLDGNVIFKGEIAKASGGVQGGIHHFGDTILFTTDNEILESISKNDTSYSYLTSKPNTSQETDERPPTAILQSKIRPITGIPKMKTSENNEQILFGANTVSIVLLENWGSKGVIGLTGFEIIQGDTTVKLTDNQITSSIGGEQFNYKLINDKNLTTKPQDMWLVPFDNNEIVLTVNFKEFKYISGLHIWNYNESVELSYAGVKIIKIFLDDKQIVNPYNGSDCFILRRAPGNEHYNFVQEINFCELQHLTNNATIEQLNNTIMGFVIQIVVYSTWGDKYYCGLNGIKLYNCRNEEIILQEQNVCAYPESLNVLPNVVEDVRTPDKLIDGINNDKSGAHSWLAPIIPKHLNRIYIIFDVPTSVSKVKIWNYTKHTTRGVKDFGILIDDLLICNGMLNEGNDEGQVVDLCDNEQDDKSMGQDVLLVNDEKGKNSVSVDETLRPFTCMKLSRGFTSYSN